MTVDVHGGIHSTATGRFIGHTQGEADPTELLTREPLDPAEHRRTAVMDHLVGNQRMAFGYMRGFTGGQPHEMAAVAAVLADSDLYNRRTFEVSATDTGVILTTPVTGGGQLMERVELTQPQDQTWRGAGLAATQDYADALDQAMSRMNSVLHAIESRTGVAPGNPVEEAPRDPRTTMLVAAGQEEFDFDGEHFKMASNVWAVPPECYAVAIRMDKPASDEQMQQFAQLAGYTWRSTVNGESLGDPERIDMFTFRMYADSTKGHGYLTDFWSKLPETVEEGSPVRKTNRSGENTKGTRLVEGLGTRRFEIYFS